MDTSVKRINLKLPAYVQDYYKEIGDQYNIPYSNYITLVLIQHYEQAMSKKLATDLNASLLSLKDMVGDNPQVTMADSKQMLEEIKSLAESFSK